MTRHPVGLRPAAAEARGPAALFTVDEIASTLRLSVRQVRRMIKSGDLPVLRFGRAVRISLATLDALLKS